MTGRESIAYAVDRGRVSHTIHATLIDTAQRHWTIVTEPTVVGYRWRIYVHPDTVGVEALELHSPGGVAHGWTHADHCTDSMLSLLRAFMGFNHAVERDSIRAAAIDAIRRWGSREQVVAAVEELAELAEALLHFRRGKVSVGKVAEEIAGVEIMLEQMRLLVALGDPDAMDNDPDAMDNAREQQLAKLRAALDK